MLLEIELICYENCISEFYISMLVCMHMYDFKCRIMTGNTSKQGQLKRKEKVIEEKETPRTVFFLLGGKDVISLSYALEYFNFCILLYLSR